MQERISVLKTDITTLAVDAIVNAANTTLLGGGGVDGAIHRAAGPELYDECARLGGCATGKAKLTRGYKLPAKYVIHAVGPVWGNSDEDAKLASAITGTLRVADELKCTSVAMPAISTGIFGFPKDRAAGIIFKSVNTYFGAKGDSTVKLVRIVLFDDASVKVFLDVWKGMWGK